jgi:hypothetical protein
LEIGARRIGLGGRKGEERRRGGNNRESASLLSQHADFGVLIGAAASQGGSFVADVADCNG